MRQRVGLASALAIAVAVALVAGAAATRRMTGPRHGILFSHGGDLYLWRLDWAQPRRISSSAREPAWAPNGGQIAFTKTLCGTDPPM